METILLLCLGAFLTSLPFGYWRAGLRRLSWQWFAAIHLPVPLIFVMRRVAGEGWSMVPVLIVCSVLGQLAGGLLRQGIEAMRQVPEKVHVENEDL